MIGTRLSNVCEITMGQAPEGASYNFDGNGLPLLAGAGDFGDLFPSPSKFTTSPGKISKTGDIIVCIRATIGDLNWSDKEYCLGRGVAGLRPNNKELDKQYLWNWLRASKDKLEKNAKGSTFKQISRDDIASLQIPLPPLDEQKRIAGILDKADAIRRKRAESLKLLDELLRATFLDMFGDPITNPKGWPTKGLLELFDITTGKLDSNAAVADGQYPFFTCARESFWIDNYTFDGEVLLLAGNNASADYSVKHYKGKFNAYQRTYVMSLKDQRNHYRLFKIALESRLGELKRRSKGTNTKYLTMGILKEIMLPVPDYNLQNQFDKIAQKVEAKCQKLNAYASESDILFHSLVARAFKGEL